MVFVKILGFMDLLAALVLFLLFYDIGYGLAYVLFWYLLFKSIIFFSAKITLFDLLSAIFLIAGSYGHHTPLAWISIIWLVQKGIISMLS